MSDVRNMSEWRGSVSSDLRHIKATAERIEASFIRHMDDDSRRFDRIDKQTRYLLAKIAGIASGMALLTQLVVR